MARLVGDGACTRGQLSPTRRSVYDRRVRKWEAAMGSMLFFVLNPGLMGGIVPWLLTGWRSADPPRGLQALGGALIVVGTGVLLETTIRFVRDGTGTPHPVAPTQELVIGGPYRYIRNPMYLAVIAAILG